MRAHPPPVGALPPGLREAQTVAASGAPRGLRLVTRRSYQQSCGIARALDLLGERWTLLIVRDLMIGPRRYSDLLSGLPGIGTNILADRLKLLETEGLVARHPLPPPAEGVVVYALTPAGRELEPVLHTLVRWSWKHLKPSRAARRSDPRWTVLALRAMFEPSAAVGLRATYAFEISGVTIAARIENGTIETMLGAPADPDVSVRTEQRTLDRLREGSLSLEEAIASGALEITGTRAAVERMFSALSRR